MTALDSRITGKTLRGIRLGNPFVLRTVSPSAAECADRQVLGLRRLGKRIAIELAGDAGEPIYIVIHLMIAGRLHWRPAGAKVGGKANLAALDFADGTLTLTEASSKKRASIHIERGEAGLVPHLRGGLEVLGADPAAFRNALLCENHTLKRALTDPRLFSGIGNAYSDEILHRARLSPVRLTGRLTPDEVDRLYEATQAVFTEWIERLGAEARKAFPEKVTAFRPEMAVHGRFGQPCPDCGRPVQRIVYAENECNYCAECQTGGRLLADRGLSRLLKSDWPKTLEEMEERRRG